MIITGIPLFIGSLITKIKQKTATTALVNFRGSKFVALTLAKLTAGTI